MRRMVLHTALAAAAASLALPRIADDVPVIREPRRSSLNPAEQLSRQQRRKAERAARKKTRRAL